MTNVGTMLMLQCTREMLAMAPKKNRHNIAEATSAQNNNQGLSKLCIEQQTSAMNFSYYSFSLFF
jgi:hypothetical protein